MKKYLDKFSPAITLIAGIIAGVMLVFKPLKALDSVITIIGWGLIIAGAFMAVNRFLSGKRDIRFFSDSLILAVGGIAVLLLAGFIKGIVPVLIGIILIASGAYKLKSAYVMKSGRGNAWIYLAVMALLSIGFGIFVLCQPATASKAVLRIIGVLILIECAEDLFAIKLS